MPQVAQDHTTVIKRRVLTLAAKMSKYQINAKINSLLDALSARKAEGVPCGDLKDELSCWAELWLRRNK